MFSGSIPKSRTRSSLVDTATKCRATARSSPSRETSQARAERALVSVSCVVKVLDSMTKSVVSGSTRARVSARSVPSRFETKCPVRSGRPYAARAVATMAGPRSEPPMPMLTTERMALPV